MDMIWMVSVTADAGGGVHEALFPFPSEELAKAFAERVQRSREKATARLGGAAVSVHVEEPLGLTVLDAATSTDAFVSFMGVLLASIDTGELTAPARTH